MINELTDEKLDELMQEMIIFGEALMAVTIGQLLLQVQMLQL